MISSMTGFGEASAEIDGIACTLEIKSVNNRFLKTHLRLPDIAAFLENDVEAKLRNELHRGTVNCSLHLKNVSGQAIYNLDENALKGYVDQLKNIAKSEGVSANFDLSGLLSLPGVVQPFVPDAEQAEKLKKTVLGLVDDVIEKLKQVRLQEGAAMLADLEANCGLIAERLVSVRDKSGAVLKEYNEKLLKRVNELQATAKLEIDSEMLARETAIFAERSDIAEEITRLSSHLEQFIKNCKTEENVGRKLDFTSQEMLREANTIASKASDALICQWVIEIKCAIDRIKEQIQNIE
jgi:uncharacterized protein (TIGR00255 family)